MIKCKETEAISVAGSWSFGATPSGLFPVVEALNNSAVMSVSVLRPAGESFVERFSLRGDVDEDPVSPGNDRALRGGRIDVFYD